MRKKHGDQKTKSTVVEALNSNEDSVEHVRFLWLTNQTGEFSSGLLAFVHYGQKRMGVCERERSFRSCYNFCFWSLLSTCSLNFLFFFSFALLFVRWQYHALVIDFKLCFPSNVASSLPVEMSGFRCTQNNLRTSGPPRGLRRAR